MLTFRPEIDLGELRLGKRLGLGLGLGLWLWLGLGWVGVRVRFMKLKLGHLLQKQWHTEHVSQ